VLDGTTGRQVGSVSASHRVPSPTGGGGGFAGSADAPPQLATVNGKQLALTGYVVQLAGHGTTPPSLAVEVDAVDARGNRQFEILAPVAGDPQNLSGVPVVSFVGVAGSVAIATVGDSDDGTSTVAVDLAARKALWHSSSFTPEAVAGTTLIGTTGNTDGFMQGGAVSFGTSPLVEVSAASGQTIRRLPGQVADVQVTPAGNGTALVEASDGSGHIVLSLLNTHTGKSKVLARQKQTGPGDVPWSCQFDGRATVVCSDSTGYTPLAFAVDGASGRVLWQLPDKHTHRVAPTITAVYEGYVSGRTENGPVVIDARSGKDISDSPKIAPVLVDASIGIADSAHNGLEAYPAR